MHKIRCKGKHRFLIFILLYTSLVTFEFYGQIAVSNTDLPSVGQNFTTITCAVPPTIKIKPNDFFSKNINYSLFKRIKSDTIRYLSAPKTRYGKQFPSSNLAAVSTAQQITYYKTDSSSVFETGTISDFMNIGKPVLIAFAKPIRKYKLPLKYKDYIRDTSENKLVTPYFIIPGIDSIRADITIIKETVIDSFGTVITPFKVFETIRERETVFTIVAGYKFSMFGWTPAPEYSRKEKVMRYRWYALEMGIPILEALTDRNGFVVEFSYQNIEKMRYDFLKTDVSCKGKSDGFLQIVLSGGVPDYTFSWTHEANGNILKGIPAGLYRFKIIDNKDSSIRGEVYIDEPFKDLSVKKKIENITCFGAANGVAALSFSGGTPPYTVKWETGSELTEQKNLRPGIFTFTLRDSHWCTLTDSVKILQPEKELAIDFELSKVTCKGSANGKISVQASGGTAPYTYLWSNGKQTAIADSLPAGSYTAKVTDAQGCTLEKNFNLTEPETMLAVTAEIKHEQCYQSANGEIKILPTGGSAPYEVLWENGSADRRITALAPGNYKVTVTDKNNCTITDEYKITGPEKPLSFTYLNKNISCKGFTDGAISLKLYGGTQPYTTVWNSQLSGTELTNLKKGNYRLQIEDKNGCKTDTIFIITEPESALNVDAKIEAIACKNTSEGSITLEIEGGDSPYKVVWNTGTEAPYLKNLTVGTYSATITDARNCKLTESYTITEPEKVLNLEKKITQPKCYGEKNAEIQLAASGGTAPYTYKIGNTPDSISINLTEGNYMVRVTDSQNCSVIDSVFIKSPRKLTVQTNIRNTLPAYATGSIETCVTGGMPPYSYSWDDKSTKPDRYFLAQGPYSLIVTDFNECHITLQAAVKKSNPKAFELTPFENELPVYNPDSPAGSCKSSAPYSIKIFNSNGISVALYAFSENKFHVQGSNLASGLYHYLVFDKYGNAVYKANFFIK